MTCQRCPRLERERDAALVDLANVQTQNLALMRRLDDKKTSRRRDEASLSEDARAWIDHWQTVRPEHQGKQVIDSRVRRVHKWLNHYSLDDLKLVADGVQFSRWHIRGNRGKELLTDVKWLLRDEETIDELIELAKTRGANRNDGPRGVQAVLAELEDVKPVGPGKWIALCPVPAHEDRTPSLSVDQGRKGAVIQCRVGCSTADVLAAIGVPQSVLFDDAPLDLPQAPSPRLPSLAQMQAWHRELLDHHLLQERVRAAKGWGLGTLRHFAVGWDRDDKRLMIPSFAPGAELRSLMRYRPKDADKMKAWPGSKRDLFPLPETLPTSLVWLFEGEPDGITGFEYGFPAIAIPGVPFATKASEWAERLKDRRVVVCFDCDDPGREAAERVCHALAKTTRDVRSLDLDPNRSDGWDVSDALLEGVTGYELRQRAQSTGSVRRFAA